MRIKALLLLSIYLYLITGCKKDNILKLPITYHKGYGPFEASGGGSFVLYNDDEKNPWKFVIYKYRTIIDKFVDLKPTKENFKLISQTLDKTKNEYFNLPAPKHD